MRRLITGIHLEWNSGVLYEQLSPAHIPEPWKKQCHSLAKAKKSSHKELEYTSNLDSELEEESTTSEEDTFLSIQYSSPPNFPTPYLCNWDFKNANKALKYILKIFNPKVIHNSLLAFSTLLRDIVYYSTYIDSDHFTQLQNRINKSIYNHNVYHEKQLEHYARQLASDINPLISHVSYSWHSLFLPCHEHSFKKVEHCHPKSNGSFG